MAYYDRMELLQNKAFRKGELKIWTELVKEGHIAPENLKENMGSSVSKASKTYRGMTLGTHTGDL